MDNSYAPNNNAQNQNPTNLNPNPIDPNSINPANQQPQDQQFQNQQPQGPQPLNMTFGPDGAPVTGVKLETPILSPTQTADNLRGYRQPQLAQPQAQTQAPRINSTSVTLLSIVLGIFAVVGIALGVFGIVDAATTSDQLATTEAELAVKTAIVKAVEQQTSTEIKSAKDVPTYVATTGYIYLSEWGIKLAIPSELHHISYILNQRLYHPTVCFNGIETSITNPLPAFTDVAQNPGGMGCLVRIATEEGDRGSDGLSFGEKVFSDNGYNYFYTTPSKTFATDNSEIQLEKHAVALIKTMLSTENISTYK